MYIRAVRSEEYGKFIAFQKKIYAGDAQFRDLQSVSLKGILRRKAEITRGSRLEAYFVWEEGREEVLGVFMLACIDRMADTLQIAFLDFVDRAEVFAKIHSFSRDRAKALGLSKLLLGLNLHVNYGLGLLPSGFEKRQSFGSAYNKAYYIRHIERCMQASDILYSYRCAIKDIPMPLPEKTTAYLEQNFTVKKADFRNIRKTAALYTSINNRAFAEHKYYYEARPEEDIELLRSFRFLIEEKNLLFVYHKGEAVGFMLWYPDFNRLLREGEGFHLRSLLRCKLQAGKMDTLRLVEIGVLPAFRNRGAGIALLAYLHRTEGKRYRYLESGWIMEENAASKGIALRFVPEVYKQFRVYEEVL